MSLRESIAAGDFLTRLDNERLLVDSPFEKQGWTARLPGAQRQAPHPGSAIRFEERLYEVVAASLRDGRYSYTLAPWDKGFAIRKVFDYGAAEARRSVAERRARARHEKSSALLILLGPLLGLLPSEDQFRLEAEYSTPAARNTLISAILIFAPTFPVFLLLLAGSFVGAMILPGWLVRWIPLLIYLCFESMIRGIVSAKVEQPLGSLPVVLPIVIYRAVVDALDPQRRKARREQRDAARNAASVWRGAEDRIRSLGEDGTRLEIISLLEKPHWTAFRTGIHFRGNLYFLAERDTSGQGRELRHRFVLEKAAPEVVFASAIDYETTEVQELHRQAEIAKRQTWAETFAPLWGLLEAPLQEQLKRLYGHEPLRQAKTGALFLIAAGGLGILLSIRNLLTGIGGPADLLVGVLSVLVLLESLDRRAKIDAGVVASSRLGVPLEPLARALLFF